MHRCTTRNLVHRVPVGLYNIVTLLRRGHGYNTLYSRSLAYPKVSKGKLLEYPLSPRATALFSIPMEMLPTIIRILLRNTIIINHSMVLIRLPITTSHPEARMPSPIGQQHRLQLQRLLPKFQNIGNPNSIITM